MLQYSEYTTYFSSTNGFKLVTCTGYPGKGGGFRDLKEWQTICTIDFNTHTK